MTDIQSAQGIASKAMEIFYTELKPRAPSNSAAFITKLEKSLTELDTSIKNKLPPVKIMEIAHTQVHPNLGEAYNLQFQ